MSNAEFQLRGVGDARLAVHATSHQPVWLWSVDGTRILWANPVGARLFGARNGAALAARAFGPADPHRRQLAQLAPRLSATGAVRLERLRGFGAAPGGLMTCACSRLEFADGSAGILVVAAAFTGRGMPLVERLQNLVEGIDTPIASFARDGLFIGANDAARALLGFRNLSEAGLETARSDALKDGRVETPIGFGHVVLQRVGSGADVGLVALIAPAPASPAEPMPAPAVAEIEPAGLASEPTDMPTPHETPAATEVSEPAGAVAAAAEEESDRVAEELLEASIADTIAHAAIDTSSAPPDEVPAHAPSPVIEAVADQPAPAQAAPLEAAPIETPVAEEAPAQPTPAMETALETPPEPPVRRQPLRFTWQMDADGRFALGSDEFTRLLGSRTSASFGRHWREIAEDYGLDPDGRVLSAVATHNTWSGITLLFPADGGARLPVELSGLPVYDRARNFAGYRGFGVCRDLDALARLAELRRHEFVGEPPPQSLSADIVQAGPAADHPDQPNDSGAPPSDIEAAAREPQNQTEPDTTVEPPKNVVPFRASDLKSPALTPVENSAFNELARQLSARLEAETGLTGEPQPSPLEAEEMLAQIEASDAPASASDAPDWLAEPAPPARGEVMRDKILLDLMPVGVLIYRLDRLLYANPAFLARTGYPTLHALEDAGGLDVLYVEPSVSGGSTADGGKAVTISGTDAGQASPLQPTDAKLFPITWDADPALALIFEQAGSEPRPEPATPAVPEGDGAADAEELGAILDTTAEGIVMFDAEGNINSCNRSAEALFGYDGAALTQRNLVDLFAPESQRVVGDYLDSIKSASVAAMLDHGREALGQVREGGLVPLSVMMGRTREDGPNFFAVFRDLTQIKKTETELLNARRQADRAATAKADVLARISHEVRTPLNAIIGFAEVMTEQRFGPLGNERYVEYMKDIRVSGERVIAIINDLLDLSRIETGNLDLAFTNQNLNEMVEQCVAVMQPQANRGRIIIRTSLAHTLPRVVADARALRQIALNLIGNSIHLANAGGQVIVSTALSDFGDVVLRVRDTGQGLNDNELAAAMEPFNSHAPADHTSESAGVSLSLTKALVEANRARFQIKTAPSSGTLIEVVFSHAPAKA
ncbi:PAS domain-containing protein [Rhodopseudomonas sp. RCAM05734]|uniref:PAS domain-containing protein n=1 Tax=Rhodopseudomonas sp. RCAM05734 TaxID=3457549 RepID=UPI0040449996